MTEKPDDKSKLEKDLEAMPPEQFEKVRGMVNTEHLRRDHGASEAEFRRKLGNMTWNEFEAFKSTVYKD
jgi:hypothetical protein